ncbi:hypothetical protein PF005_g6270 [Phytophthora fragariae]|uniref:Uncharacterized protein n=1 Tax=Phytophthora fragariae TaxID=53985 RepID=A0A6A4EPL1_9STRA|nr:hypothetical protein PF003_g32429 [Phytophthora fragariae]KAE8947029.1 hypothetical protein PF009_g3343 [Phytophthora fragariae]KAE9002062.1 hypothetical protein PF011_g13476 [Phytophthora fragariae]KAE9123380.1 hypothetical protein PF007_g7071 [Phytophthora fragariae]KAE9152009.1 hypothetical protein PF006_g3737 [Phytophthora fragariae]
MKCALHLFGGGDLVSWFGLRGPVYSRKLEHLDSLEVAKDVEYPPPDVLNDLKYPNHPDVLNSLKYPGNLEHLEHLSDPEYLEHPDGQKDLEDLNNLELMEAVLN